MRDAYSKPQCFQISIVSYLFTRVSFIKLNNYDRKARDASINQQPTAGSRGSVIWDLGSGAGGRGLENFKIVLKFNL